jgi:hypothetical protein
MYLLLHTHAAVEADPTRYMELFPEEFLSRVPGDSASGNSSGHAASTGQEQVPQQQGVGGDVPGYFQPQTANQQAAVAAPAHTIGPADPRPTRPQRQPTLIPPTASLMSAHVSAGGYKGSEPFHSSPPSTDIDMMVRGKLDTMQSTSDVQRFCAYAAIAKHARCTSNIPVQVAELLSPTRFCTSPLLTQIHDLRRVVHPESLLNRVVYTNMPDAAPPIPGKHLILPPWQCISISLYQLCKTDAVMHNSAWSVCASYAAPTGHPAVLGSSISLSRLTLGDPYYQSQVGIAQPQEYCLCSCKLLLQCTITPSTSQLIHPQYVPEPADV